MFYVALTRTVETLVISGAAQMPYADAMQMRLQVRPEYGANATLIASPFLHELGPDRPATETTAHWRARVGF